MTTDVVWLVFYLLLALGVSFLCSVLEAVLLSITPGYVAALEKEGSKASERIKKLKAQIDKPLAAILSLNTIAHTVGAAGVGAQSAKVFGDGYMGVTSGVLTVLILIGSEIVPKSLGASYWKKLAPLVALVLGPITFLLTITGLVPIAQVITRMLGGVSHGALPSREEISAIAEQGAREGVFPIGEGRILANLFRLGSLRARDIMTPRTVILGLEENQRIGDLMKNTDSFPFSRIPIYKGTIDEISGYVLRSDVLLKAARDEHEITLADLRRELKCVATETPLSTLFEALLHEQAHVALVLDDYGGTAGLVTMEDVVETLIGMEIVDEADAVTDMRELARKQWKKRARRMGVVVLEDPPEDEVEGSSDGGGDGAKGGAE